MAVAKTHKMQMPHSTASVWIVPALVNNGSTAWQTQWKRTGLPGPSDKTCPVTNQNQPYSKYVNSKQYCFHHPTVLLLD